MEAQRLWDSSGYGIVLYPDFDSGYTNVHMDKLTYHHIHSLYQRQLPVFDIVP